MAAAAKALDGGVHAQAAAAAEAHHARVAEGRLAHLAHELGELRVGAAAVEDLGHEVLQSFRVVLFPKIILINIKIPEIPHAIRAAKYIRYLPLTI